MKASEVLKITRPLFEKDTLFNIINRFKREFYIKIQDRMIRSLAKLANLFPEPERNLVRRHNSKVWLDILDEFLEYENNWKIKRLVQCLRKVLIGKIESSNYYWERVDFLVEQIAKRYNDGSFKKRPSHTPNQQWAEPSVVDAKGKIMKELENSILEKTYRRN